MNVTFPKSTNVSLPHKSTLHVHKLFVQKAPSMYNSIPSRYATAGFSSKIFEPKNQMQQKIFTFQ